MYKTKITGPGQKYNDNANVLNILIVDDDEYSRESLKDIIEMRDHKVTVLDEGMKCVNRCSENTYDLIFMDYHINDLDGEINGTDVVQMVREYFDINTPVYAYTGDNSLKAITDFKNNNMKGAFIKPVDPRLMCDFLKIIEKSINDLRQLPKLARRHKNFMFFGKKNNFANVTGNIK
jgi:CheY-like chemotaxis protein